MPEYFLPRDLDRAADASSRDDPESVAIVGASDGIEARDSEEGMEIALPEGQRITIGALPPGTIIEVISWQGTGSPGPKASRLLLGTARADETTVRITAPTADGAAQEFASPTADPATLEASLRRRPRIGATFRTIAWSASIAALVLIPQALGILRWTVIDHGPSWALGSTRGSVAIAAGTTEVSEGDRALVRPQGSSEDWFGDVVTTDDGGLAVRTGSISVPTEGRARSVRAIVPWIGYPVLWVRSLLG